MYKLSKKEIAARVDKRGSYSPRVLWYAVMAHCGREVKLARKIEQELGESGVESVLVPEYRGPENRSTAKPGELLFHSYVFIRCLMSDPIYMQVAAQQEVLKILGEAWRIPAPISDVEMNRLRSLLSAVEKPELVRAIGVGDEVIVTSGLMKGMKGRVVGRNGQNIRLQTRFSFLDPGAAVCVTVPRSIVSIQMRDLVATIESDGSSNSETVKVR